MNDSTMQRLLDEIKEAYENSDIKKKNDNWSYALFGSKPTINPILLLGLNFGSAQQEKYSAQTLEGIKESKLFSQMDGNDLGQSFLRLKNYIKNYDAIDIKKITWSNFCFFRSYSDKDLSKKDFELTKPIFNKMLQEINPQVLICVSKELYYFLDNENLLKDKVEKNILINSKNHYTVVKSKLYNYNFYCLPHPNYPASYDGRKKCWDFCFK